VEVARSAGQAQNLPGRALPAFGPCRGPRRAAIAVAHATLVAIYHLIGMQAPYQDLGAGYFAVRRQGNVEQRLVKRLERLGYAGALQPRAG
jgi:transposase